MIEETMILLLVLAWPISGVIAWMQACEELNQYGKKLGLKRWDRHPEGSDYAIIPVALFLGPLTFLANAISRP